MFVSIQSLTLETATLRRLNNTVNMVRNSVEAGGRDRFSCSAGAWGLLLDLGKAFGWKSHGTSYVPSDLALVPDRLARHDYQPGDAQDSKLVDAADALEWAKALSAARDSPHLTAMIGDRTPVAVPHHTATSEELRSANVPFIIIMDEFIAYAFDGEFVFSHE